MTGSVQAGTLAVPETGLPARTLADLLRRPAARSGNSPAVVGDGRSASYAELADRSNRLACGLLDLGLSRGDRVAYLGRNATEYWDLFFGTAKAGLVIVPLNFRLAAAEVAWILADADVSAVVVEQACAAALPGVDVPVLRFADPAGPADPPEPVEGWRELEPWLAEQRTDDPVLDGRDDELAALMYSSGTTGRPKGVRITVGGLLWAVKAFGARFDVDETSVSLVPTPYYHIAAGGWSLITLAAGGRLVQFQEPTPATMLAAIRTHRATHAAMVPVILQILCAVPDLDPADVASLRYVVYGASPIPVSLMLRAKDVFGAELSQSYGLTETLGVTTLLGPADHVPEPATVHRLRSAGRAVEGIELAIVDPDSGATLVSGAPGEVVVRGPSVTTGYWRRPEATAEAFLADGWFRTGDVGTLDDEGYLYLKDRLKDLIVSGGENIYPAEVENALAGHPDVGEVAVIGIPSPRWAETPLAVIVPVAGAHPAEAELIDYCRARLAHFKCPTAVRIVDVLPRNPSGKVLKRYLRQPFWADQERTIG